MSLSRYDFQRLSVKCAPSAWRTFTGLLGAGAGVLVVSLFFFIPAFFVPFLLLVVFLALVSYVIAVHMAKTRLDYDRFLEYTVGIARQTPLNLTDKKKLTLIGVGSILVTIGMVLVTRYRVVGGALLALGFYIVSMPLMKRYWITKAQERLVKSHPERIESVRR